MGAAGGTVGSSQHARASSDYGGGMPRLSALAPLTVGLLLLTGCSFGPPIVPPDISAMVNEQGRERTYDLVWQDIRRFEGALERGESADFNTQALIILSRINRLAEGKVSGMREEEHRITLDAAKKTGASLNAAERQQLLHETAIDIRIAFDEGRFAIAQEGALRALAYSQNLSLSDENY